MIPFTKTPSEKLSTLRLIYRLSHYNYHLLKYCGALHAAVILSWHKTGLLHLWRGSPVFMHISISIFLENYRSVMSAESQ